MTSVSPNCPQEWMLMIETRSKSLVSEGVPDVEQYLPLGVGRWLRVNDGGVHDWSSVYQNLVWCNQISRTPRAHHMAVFKNRNDNQEGSYMFEYKYRVYHGSPYKIQGTVTWVKTRGKSHKGWSKILSPYLSRFTCFEAVLGLGRGALKCLKMITGKIHHR